MVNTILPISAGINTSAAARTSASGGSTALTQDDFTRILLAQMASPDLSSLFETNNTNNGNSSDPLSSGYTSSLFGNLSSLLPPQLSAGSGAASGSISSQLFGNYATGLLPSMGLSVWSNLIGKTVEAVDKTTGQPVSGKVASVVMQNGTAMLDTGSTLIDPATVTKVS